MNSPAGSRRLLHLRPRSVRLESATARTHCGDFEPLNIHENHVALLMELGYTEPEARFLYVVATHSGYFILRQFLNFTGARRGKRSNLFARKVLNNGHGSVRDYLGYGPSINFFRGLSTAKSRKAISEIASSIRLNTFVRVWSCLVSSSLILKPSISKPSRTRSLSSAKN